MARARDHLRALETKHSELLSELACLKLEKRSLLLRQAMLGSWLGALSMMQLHVAVDQEPDQDDGDDATEKQLDMPTIGLLQTDLLLRQQLAVQQHDLAGSSAAQQAMAALDQRPKGWRAKAPLLHSLLQDEVGLLQKLTGADSQEASHQPTLEQLLQPDYSTIAPRSNPMAYLHSFLDRWVRHKCSQWVLGLWLAGNFLGQLVGQQRATASATLHTVVVLLEKFRFLHPQTTVMQQELPVSIPPCCICDVLLCPCRRPLLEEATTLSGAEVADNMSSMVQKLGIQLHRLTTVPPWEQPGVLEGIKQSWDRCAVVAPARRAQLGCTASQQLGDSSLGLGVRVSGVLNPGGSACRHPGQLQLTTSRPTYPATCTCSAAPAAADALLQAPALHDLPGAAGAAGRGGGPALYQPGDHGI